MFRARLVVEISIAHYTCDDDDDDNTFWASNTFLSPEEFKIEIVM